MENPEMVRILIRQDINHTGGMMKKKLIESTTASKLVNSVTGAGEAELVR